MSHSTVLIVGKDPKAQLAPFDEGKVVEAYLEPCYCIGRKARHEAMAMVDKEYMTIDALRTTYHAMPHAERPAWPEHIKRYNELETKYDKAHPEHGKPDPKCEDCKGSGKRESKYNPDSKWDWYALGGRWSGYFKLTASAKKRLGASITEFVGHPGVFDNKPLFDADMAQKKDIDFKGMLKFKTARAEAGWEKIQAALKSPDENTRKRAEVDLMDFGGKVTKEQYVKECVSTSTFAVLMNGEWYEKGHMGWWGFVSDEKSDDAWDAEFQKLLDSLPGDTWLSVYDVHI